MDAIPKDLTGKLAVVTGANSGIGLEACIHLAKRKCEIVMCCRSVNKAEEARAQIIKQSGMDAATIHVVQLDLADLDNIRSFRQRYDVEPGLAGKPIDYLILNAGIMALNKRELTKQGIEAQMGTNVVGHFAFTAAMIDLCKAAPTSRIVAVSSGAHHMAPKHGITFDDFNRDKSYKKWQVYGETKLGNLLFVAKLNRLLEEKQLSNIIAVGCHPGYSNTHLQDDTVFKWVNVLFAQSPVTGALPTVLAATDPAAKRNGYAGPSRVFEMWGAPKWGCGKNKLVRDTALQDKLWEKCEELTHADLAAKL